MHSTTLAALAIATGFPLATTAAPAHADTSTVREKGVLVECSGTWRSRPVTVSGYENRTHGNELVVAVGTQDQEHFWVSTPDGRLVRRGELQQEGSIDGRKAVLAGRLVRDGEPVEVHDEFDDAGQHVVVDGVHEPLAADLVLTWRKRNAVLDCDDAFRFDLTVTKTDIE